jgi:autophagy-related protein 11
MAVETEERAREMDVMLRCLDAAVANLAGVVKNIEPRLAEVRKWAPKHQTEYTALTTRWEQNLSLARSVPVAATMVRFMTGRDMSAGKGRPQRQATLEDLVELETARRSGRSAPSALRKFNGRVADLDKSGSRFLQDTERLFRDFDRTAERSDIQQYGESLQLLQDIEAVAKKVDTDYQTTLELAQTGRDVLQVSKIAHNHTERLLPSIKNRSLELNEMLRFATESRNSLARDSVAFMRNISEITSASNSIKAQLNDLTQDDELATFDYLRLIHQVPYMYATFLVEAIRRREWFEKVKQDSSTLANEMAVFQDEEVKRRRRWLKTIDDTYGPSSLTSDGKVPGLEVNLLGEEEQWPTMSRQDLQEFLESLQKEKADAEVVEDVGKLISELNNPSKQQSKRLKAFKNGSIHEAALGRSGLLIRGDDDLLRSLQDDKFKLENKLRTAESRVRRLEDLLHRHSQASRPNPGNIFQLASQPARDRTGSLTSVGSPLSSEDRRSLSDGEGLLFQRVQQLEAELNAEKERSAALEQELEARTTQHDDVKGQMQEANLTKKDLLENMEALKRETVEEQKALEDEIKRLQARLEDTEDEIEHFGESREHEKAGYRERLRELEMENDRLVKEKKDDLLKAEGQVEFLRKETRLQRERMEALETQLQAAQEDANRSATMLNEERETAAQLIRALRDISDQLWPNKTVSEGVDMNELISVVSEGISEFVAKVNSVEGDLALARADLELAQSNTRDLRSAVESARGRLAEREVTEMHLREELGQEKAKAAALERELVQGREQLDELRAKLADGETGSESLRKKLEEDEARLGSMTEELASRQSQVGSLEEELLLFRERLQDSQARLSDVSSRLEARTERAKDLTQRLYSQNDRLCRLLERIGFSVSREGDSMVFRKVPRSERSQNSTNDVSETVTSGLRRSGTLNSRVLADSVDLELLYWMKAGTDTEESERYKGFLSALGSFDTDAFTETVYKRVKDIQQIATRLQKDARGYREKAHTLHKDSHDKIAFKNFKEGDLALFLPTRNQKGGAWAAFNVGCPHYFLREQESHRLRNREWLVARISKIQERIVDLSKTLSSTTAKDSGSVGHDADSINDDEYDNPFDLSDGLRWYLIDAAEDKPGAPSTPGLGKSTVAANKVDAMADMHPRNSKNNGVLGVVAGRGTGIEGVSKSLSKSLESRRSSTGSRKALPFAAAGIRGQQGRDSAVASETNSLRAVTGDTPVETSPTQTRFEQHLQGHAPRPSTPLSAVKSVDEAGTDGKHAEPSPAVGGQGSSEVRKTLDNPLDTLLGP